MSFVRLYIAPGLGAKRIDRLQNRDVQSWINKLGRTCQCCEQGKDARRLSKERKCCAIGECCEDYLSTRTVSDIRAALRAALNNAKDSDELITRNPAASVKLPTIRKRRGKAWSSEEARKFLEFTRNNDDSLYAAYVLTLVLGLRRGEVLGLTWQSFAGTSLISKVV